MPERKLKCPKCDNKITLVHKHEKAFCVKCWIEMVEIKEENKNREIEKGS